MSENLRERLAAAFRDLDDPTPEELKQAWREAAVTLEDVLPFAGDPGVYPYGRKKLYDSANVEILVMNWAARRECAPHDHGSSFGWVHILSGTVQHTLYTLDKNDMPARFSERTERAGTKYFAPRSLVHSMGNAGDEQTVTVHVYSPPITGMKVYDLERCAVCVVSDDCGAWWPDDQRQLVKEIRLRSSSARPVLGAGALVGPEVLLNPAISNGDVRSLLSDHAVDVAAMAEIPRRTAVHSVRHLTVHHLDRSRPAVVVESPPGGGELVVVSGRAEVIPLLPRKDAELVGEGQVRSVTPGAAVAVRLSASTEAACLVEVSYGEQAMTDRPDLLPEADRIEPLPDYYYGYSDRYAAVYAAGAESWEPPQPNDVLDHALRELAIKPCSVIDLGCGEGRDTLHLAGSGYSVVGVDVARPALDKARERAAALGLDALFLERDVVYLSDLPRRDFDLALNMGCLHMIPDGDLRSRHLSRVFELLRPGGMFLLAHCREHWLRGFFSVPDYASVGPVVPGRVIERRIRLKDGGTAMLPLPLVPYKEADESELAAELVAHGFEVVATLSMEADAFGDTAVLAARRPEVTG